MAAGEGPDVFRSAAGRGGVSLAFDRWGDPDGDGFAEGEFFRYRITELQPVGPAGA